MRAQQARTDVDHQRGVQGGEFAHRDRRGEAADVVVRRMHLEDEAGVGADRVGVVAQMRAVGGADLADAGAGGRHQLGQPEAVADLDQFSAADDHLPAGGERHRRQQQRGGVVVDDVHGLGGGDRGGQCGQRAPAAAGPAAGREVELDVGGAAGGGHGVDRSPRQRGPAQVGVHDHAGRVDDGPQRGRARRQRCDGVVGDLLGVDLPGAGTLLRLDDHALDQHATQSLGRRDQSRVGEHGVGARHPPARVTHVGDFGVVVCAQRRRTRRNRRGNGGGGRESNPPATGTAAQRF